MALLGCRRGSDGQVARIRLLNIAPLGCRPGSVESQILPFHGLLGAVLKISTVKVREIRDSSCNCAAVTAISAQQQALRLRPVPCGSDIPPVKARRFGDYSWIRSSAQGQGGTHVRRASHHANLSICISTNHSKAFLRVLKCSILPMFRTFFEPGSLFFDIMVRNSLPRGGGAGRPKNCASQSAWHIFKLISYCSDAASKPGPAGLPRRLGQSSRANSCTKLGPAGLPPRLRQLVRANSRTKLGPAGLPPRLRQSSRANSTTELGPAGLPPRLSRVPDLAFLRLTGRGSKNLDVKVRELGPHLVTARQSLRFRPSSKPSDYGL